MRVRPHFIIGIPSSLDFCFCHSEHSEESLVFRLGQGALHQPRGGEVVAK
jgi:hypothetical protein